MTPAGAPDTQIPRCCRGWIGEDVHRRALARTRMRDVAAPMHQRPVADTASARVLFRVAFESDMRVADADRLRRDLNMTLHLDRKHPAITPPLGITRLDRDSGLFLVHDAEREWALECRTWGDPPTPVVRGWWLTALVGAHHLDHGAQRRDENLEGPGA